MVTFYLLLKILFNFKERKGGRKWVRETSLCDKHRLSLAPGRSPGVCPHLEPNWRHFGLWNDAQSIGPHRSRPHGNILNSAWAWPVWLSWLGSVQQRKKSLVRFLARAGAWVVGPTQVGAHTRGNLSMFLTHQCFSLFLSPFLLLNK